MSQKALKSNETPLEVDLLHFDDDFIEFADYCSFMCDAFAYLATGEDYLDKNTVGGISRYCNWIKYRMEILKEDLRKIHEKAYVQSRTSCEKHNKNLKRTRNKTRTD